MPKGTETKHEQMDGIEGSIALWKQSLTVVALILMATAAGFFWIYLPATGQKPETSPIGNWGAFGDFVGGLMNPLVAFAAFYWLTQSVKIQKQELAEVKMAAQDSAKSQEKMAQASQDSMRLQACTIVIDVHRQSIGSLIEELEKQKLKLAKVGFTGRERHNTNVRIKEFEDAINTRERAQNLAFDEIEFLFKNVKSAREGIVDKQSPA